MPKLLAVRPLPNYHLWLQYDDGTTGEVDLSDLAGRGVFEAWTQPGPLRAFPSTSIREHSEDEPRELIVGHAARRRLLVVCFVQRGDRVRIFSTRLATRQERRDYEEGTS